MLKTPSVINKGLLIILLVMSSSVFGANTTARGKPSPESKITENTTQSVTKVNLNTADAATLAAKLNGVGMKKAQAIIEYREKYGLFTDINQLQEVPGFGESLVNRNLALLTI